MIAKRTRLFFGFGLITFSLVAMALLSQRALADSISFSPANGNAGTPFIVSVDGFIGSNGPVGVTIYGGGISGGCGASRPCTFEANMGNFSGKQWVVAEGIVNGVSVVVSNYFTVREAGAYLNRACGPSGTKVIVTGYDFARHQFISVDSVQSQANAEGKFTATVTIPEGQSGNFKIIASDGFRHVTNTFVIGANSVCEEDIGHAREIAGGATIRRPGGQAVPLRLGDPIRLGDEIRTGADGRVQLDFIDAASLVMTPNGSLTVDNQVYNSANNENDTSVFGFGQGAFKFVSGFAEKRDDNIRVNTPYGAIGIRGTEFISRRDPCSTTQEVYLIHGQLAIVPTNSLVTNIVNAPATIFFDATNVWTSGLTQSAYDALLNEINQTNPVTFGSWQVQYFGCTNDNPTADATADPDGDGQNNYSEFLSHTDPMNTTSVLRLLNSTRENNGLKLSWQTHGGVTNVVQAAGSIDGVYTNISPTFVIPGDEDVITNYFDPEGVADFPGRFYRIRLVP